MDLRAVGALVILAVTVIGCRTALTPGAPVDSTRLADGMFEGSASSGMDSATVRIIVQGKRITRVEIAAFEASPIGSPARDVMPQRIVEKQSTRVDVVSGATDASNVITSAAERAVQESYARAASAR
jgi:uncharacterized protein with FMN-binding domain